jgi:hypothetical protein
MIIDGWDQPMDEYRGRRTTDHMHTSETHEGRSTRIEDEVAAARDDAAERAAHEALLGRVKAIEAAGVHRRHEELISIATGEDGMPLELAEQAHELAQQEGLAPAYGLALVASGIGVQELVPPESGDDESIQSAAPDWVLEGDVGRDAIVRERRLRSSFRRFRAHLDRATAVESATTEFLAEPDVGRITY